MIRPANPDAPARPAFIPFHDSVLLEVLPRDTTAGGIHIPKTAAASLGPQQARVVRLGPGWPTEQGTRIAMDVAEGDIVYLAMSAGAMVLKMTLEGKEYLLVRMRDLLGKLENPKSE